MVKSCILKSSLTIMSMVSSCGTLVKSELTSVLQWRPWVRIKIRVKISVRVRVRVRVRVIVTRISEHIWISPLTGEKRATTLFTASSMQALARHTNHAISPNDFSIIYSCSSSFNIELLIRESFLVSKYKPSLKEKISSTPLSLF